MAQVQGSATEKFAGVIDVLEKNLANGDDVGASVTVMHHGEPVVDIWGGFADEAMTKPWERDTLVNVWSTTKTMTFLVALMLYDRGELDYSAPVARYWPEFAANGKADIEVRHLLSHSAGLSGWQEPLEWNDLANWELVTSRLAAQAPWWDDRSKSGYHACTQGFLIGEVVRRITGTTIGQFFHEEVASVLGADFYIGLPASEESRVSLVIPLPPPDFSGIDPESIEVRTLTSPPLSAAVPHERWWRAAEIPAANGHGNARSVALIQQVIANNGQVNGHRFFSEKSGERLFEVQTSGVDMVLGVDLTYGMGYGLSSSYVPLGPKGCFWGGYGGSLVVMDQDIELTIAYMMNKMRVGLIGDTRGGEFVLAAVLAALS